MKRSKARYPFFIVGCNRSGTSLMRTMLNHHPSIAIPTESVFLVDYIKTQKSIDIAVQKKLVVKEPWLKEEWLLDITKDDLVTVTDTKSLIENLHKKYAIKHGKIYWGNKTSRFTDQMEKLKTLFPQAVFINVVRDPRGVVLSLIQNKMFKSNAYFGARKWVSHIQAARRFQHLYPNDFMEVRYEDFVTKPEDGLSKICKFLNVPYSSKMFDYVNLGMSEYHSLNKTLHHGINKKPFKIKIDYWKRFLSTNQIRIIEFVCEGLMGDYGYKPQSKITHIALHEYVYLYINRLYGFVVQLVYYFIKWPKYFFFTIWRKLIFGTLLAEIRGMSY